MTHKRRVLDVRAAVGAGIVAGIVFIGLEMTLVPLLDLGSPWVPVRMIAAIALGPRVLPPPSTFDAGIFAVAMLVHFSLSVLYVTVYCAIWIGVFGLGLGRFAALPNGLFGLVLYLINFHGFVHLFPWFAEARGVSTVLVHVIWGLVLPVAYEALAGRTGPNSPTNDRRSK